MQDAVELKHFFESKRPLLMIVDSTRAESKRLLAAAGTLADPNHIVFRIKAKPTLPLTTLFELFSHHWAVRYSDVEASHSQDQLNFIVECLTAHNQNCVLLVAQAHLLSDVFLRALCRLAEVQENKMPRIRLILSGYPELVEKVNAWYSSATEKPPVVFASDVISAENKKTFLLSSQFLSKFWQMHSVKSMAVLALIISGVLWWKMQQVELLFHAKQQLPAHSESVKV